MQYNQCGISYVYYISIYYISVSPKMQDLRWVDIFRRNIYNVTEFNPCPPAVHGLAAYNGMMRTYLRGAAADSGLCRAHPGRADTHISAGERQSWTEPDGQQPRHMRMDWPEVFAMWIGLWYNVFVRNMERSSAPPAGGREEDGLRDFRGGLKKESGKEWRK